MREKREEKKYEEDGEDYFKYGRKRKAGRRRERERRERERKEKRKGQNILR